MTLNVRSAISPGDPHAPFILIHGAANSGAVWKFWQRELADRGRSSHALDLRGHGESATMDLSDTRMGDYAADVITCARQLRRPPVLLGWSMGGLVAMMAATSCGAVACIGLAPSTPVRLSDASVPIRSGMFGPEEYGIIDRDPERQPMMPDLDREERLIALESLAMESRRARDERKAGIALDTVGCPLLVVTSADDSQWPHARYEGLHLTRTDLEVDGPSHWGLVLNRRVLPDLVSAVVDWVSRTGVR